MRARFEPLPFLITVDVEGDDLWSRPRTVTTANAGFVPRFHRLCERYGLRPTYLTTFEMATCAEFRDFGCEVLRRDQGEIGMHLHAWNSPPDVPLTVEDHRHHPYLTLYPEPVMREKIVRLTRKLEQAFETPIRSHRGGRWALNEAYARLLVESGYRVDSTVTPHVSWRRTSGSPVDREAPDYSRFPETPYFLDLDDISRPGTSPLLEVPVTTWRIDFENGGARPGGPAPYVVKWLRPNGRNLATLRSIATQAIECHRDCLVLVLHSSELMPGGSPTFPGPEDVESLYHDLDALFRAVAGSVRGTTLMEFHTTWSS